MLDAFLIKEIFNVGVSKLCSVVTSHFLDIHFKLILSSSCKLLEDPLGFTFISQKEYPSEARKIINNHKTIFVTSNAYISIGSE